MTSRTKKILLLLSGLVLLGIVCAAVAFVNFRPPGSPFVENQTPATPKAKILGPFRAIEGTDYMISSVTDSPEDPRIYEDLFSSARWYGGGSGYNQYNIVFLDVTSETVYPLLPTNDFEVVSMEGFPKPVPVLDPSVPAPPRDPVAWWLISVVKADTNDDKDVSSLDKQTLSIADVGGRGYTEIIQEVDAVLGTAFKENNTLLVIYRSNEKNYLARVDLPSRQVSSTEELQLGEEIK